MKRVFILVLQGGTEITHITYDNKLKVDIRGGILSMDIDGLSDDEVIKGFNDCFDLNNVNWKMKKYEKASAKKEES